MLNILTFSGLLGLASAQYNVFLYPEQGCGENSFNCENIASGECCSNGGTLYESASAFRDGDQLVTAFTTQASNPGSYCNLVLGTDSKCYSVGSSGIASISGATGGNEDRKRGFTSSENCNTINAYSRGIDGIRYTLQLDSPEYAQYLTLSRERQASFIMAHSTTNYTVS